MSTSADSQKTDSLHADQIPSLRRIEGQVRGIADMIANKRYCVDILRQCKAVRSALLAVEEKIVIRHLDNCFSDAMRNADEGERAAKIGELLDLLRQQR